MIFSGTPAQARPVKQSKTKLVKTMAVAPVSTATNVRKPASLSSSSSLAAAADPNRAVEVRGQARTLSMMLVLKNGKENINFIQVRKDYNPEIQATEF